MPPPTRRRCYSAAATTGNLHGNRACARAFTMVELMVSMAALLAIMLVLFQAISSSSSVWTRSVGKVQAFQAARAAFEALSRNLGQATLQSYYGYATASGAPVPLVNPSFRLTQTSNAELRSRIPTRYLRMSELHFVSGPTEELFSPQMANMPTIRTSGHAAFFQAPVGLANKLENQVRPTLLNTCGYYIHFGRDDDDSGGGTAAIPTFTSGQTSTPKPSYRYRLMETLQPAEESGVYQSTNLVDADGMPIMQYDLAWITQLRLGARPNRHVLADNVLFLFFLPKLSEQDEVFYGGTGNGSLIAPSFAYDSRSWESGYPGSALHGPSAQSLVERVTMNRLPPIVEVVMVATDERSALRLAERFGGASADNPPLENSQLRSTLGLDATSFTQAQRLDDDVRALEAGLDAAAMNYRLFRTEIRIPGASYGE